MNGTNIVASRKVFSLEARACQGCDVVESMRVSLERPDPPSVFLQTDTSRFGRNPLGRHPNRAVLSRRD